MKDTLLWIGCSIVLGFVICGLLTISDDTNFWDDENTDKETTKKEITVKGADGKEFTSYRAACSKGDFDAAREFIEKMNNTKGYDTHDIKEAEEYVFNEEILYLASLNEDQANDKIVLILNQQAVNGFEAAEGHCLGKHIYGTGSYFDQPGDLAKFKLYISWCRAHNSRCNTILNSAIGCGNQNLASKILRSYRKDPELKLVEEKEHKGWNDIYAHYTSKSIDAAKKKYDEAVASGAFN